ncbi:MAG: hypothetical protein GEU80_11035 [Dehalococcoidia bacterium]|nr:hypothetical protein [Dehalococcoidia bacterium]
MHSMTAAPFPRTGWPKRFIAASVSMLALAVPLILIACDSSEGIRIVTVTSTAASGSGGGGSTAASTPTPEAVGVPPRPDNPFAGGVSVRAYLAGGRANVPACLPELVQVWGLPDVEGERCVHADIDGDGEQELLFLISVPGEPESPGEVWFFDDAAAAHRFMSSARAMANAVLTGVSFVGSPVDLTGDGRPEAVISSRACEGTRCQTGLVIASVHHGFLEDLAPDGVDLGTPGSIEVSDLDGDGLVDIVARSERVEDPAAGPQRGFARTISWNGVRFTWRDTQDPPEFLIHLVEDADAAYRSGDYSAARDLYQAVAADGILRDWKAEQGGARSGRSELVPYAYFRAALAARGQGDGATTRELLELAAEHDDSMHGTAAALYLRQLERGDANPAACSAVERFLDQFRSQYLDAWDYGYANPEHSISTLCR